MTRSRKYLNNLPNAQKIKDLASDLEYTQIKLNELSKVLILQDSEIAELKKNIHNLQSLVDDEIRDGLFQLFHQAKSDLDEAKKDIIKHQKMVEDSQHRLMNSSAKESQENHDEWIRNVGKVIKDEERVKESEKQLEAINRVYRLEFSENTT